MKSPKLDRYLEPKLEEQKALMQTLAGLKGATVKEIAPQLIAGLKDANSKLMAPYNGAPWSVYANSQRAEESAQTAWVNEHVIEWLESL